MDGDNVHQVIHPSSMQYLFRILDYPSLTGNDAKIIQDASLSQSVCDTFDTEPKVIQELKPLTPQGETFGYDNFVENGESCSSQTPEIDPLGTSDIQWPLGDLNSKLLSPVAFLSTPRSDVEDNVTPCPSVESFSADFTTQQQQTNTTSAVQHLATLGTNQASIVTLSTQALETVPAMPPLSLRPPTVPQSVPPLDVNVKQAIPPVGIFLPRLTAHHTQTVCPMHTGTLVQSSFPCLDGLASLATNIRVPPLLPPCTSVPFIPAYNPPPPPPLPPPALPGISVSSQAMPMLCSRHDTQSTWSNTVSQAMPILCSRHDTQSTWSNTVSQAMPILCSRHDTQSTWSNTVMNSLPPILSTFSQIPIPGMNLTQLPLKPIAHNPTQSLDFRSIPALVSKDTLGITTTSTEPLTTTISNQPQSLGTQTFEPNHFIQAPVPTSFVPPPLIDEVKDAFSSVDFADEDLHMGIYSALMKDPLPLSSLENHDTAEQNTNPMLHLRPDSDTCSADEPVFDGSDRAMQVAAPKDVEGLQTYPVVTAQQRQASIVVKPANAQAAEGSQSTQSSVSIVTTTSAVNLKTYMGIPVTTPSGAVRYKCELCETTFTLKQNLRRHMKRAHGNEKPYICNTCGTQFALISQLSNHIRIHTGEHPHKCNQCGKVFSKKGALTKHMALHTRTSPEKPKKVGKSPKMPAVAEETPASPCQMTAGPAATSPTCQAIVMPLETTPAHCPTTMDISTVQPIIVPLESLLPCQPITLPLETATLNQAHGVPMEASAVCSSIAMSIAASIPCPSISIPIETLTNCQQDTAQIESTLSRQVIPKYTCHICEEAFVHKKALTRHLAAHKAAEENRCPVCEEHFPQKKALMKHMVLHKEPVVHKCSICDSIFARKVELSRHIRTHNANKPFKCDICGVGFTLKNNMARHIKNHSGERPFSCEICGKSFAAKSTLKDHLRIHGGEKPFVCTICGIPFSVKGAMTKHMKTHYE